MWGLETSLITECLIGTKHETYLAYTYSSVSSPPVKCYGATSVGTALGTHLICFFVRVFQPERNGLPPDGLTFYAHCGCSARFPF